MKFAAIDVETANANRSSICQIGIATYEQGALAREWKSYVDPEDFFDPVNISIHGIDDSTVAGSPKLPDIASKLYRFLDSQICVCHTHFDRVAVHQAFEKHGLRPPSCTWLDSARVARRAWAKFAWKGYGLHSVCTHLGYEFKHHDALEDAKAAAYILLAAIDQRGLDLQGWLNRVQQPIGSSRPSKAEPIRRRDGNPEGPLYGEVLVFTGSLSITRQEAAEMASRIGCEVHPAVTKNTTMLVVGDQDLQRLAGHKISSKHKKAQLLMSKGHHIRILQERDFKQLVSFVGE